MRRSLGDSPLARKRRRKTNSGSGNVGTSPSASVSLLPSSSSTDDVVVVSEPVREVQGNGNGFESSASSYNDVFFQRKNTKEEITPIDVSESINTLEKIVREIKSEPNPELLDPTGVRVPAGKRGILQRIFGRLLK